MRSCLTVARVHRGLGALDWEKIHSRGRVCSLAGKVALSVWGECGLCSTAPRHSPHITMPWRQLPQHPFQTIDDLLHTLTQQTQPKKSKQQNCKKQKNNHNRSQLQAQLDQLGTGREANKLRSQLMLMQKLEEQNRKRNQVDQRKLQQQKERNEPCEECNATIKTPTPPIATGGPRCVQCAPKRPPQPRMIEAPLFTPTEEEFADPVAYISTIQDRIYEYGICRIKPPPSWDPPKKFKHCHGSKEGVSCSGSESSNELGALNSLESSKGTPSKEAITESTQFRARLQRVPPRSFDPERGHLQPFVCSFILDYTRIAIQDLRKFDRELRSSAFPTEFCDDGSLLPFDAVERWFWDELGGESEAKLLYCSDVDGTAFSNPEGETLTRDERWVPQALASGSLLDFVNYDIPGVNSAMLYIGMLGSMFCWHVEDSFMYSASYLHQGAPKTWYGVSPTQADQFDAVVADDAFPSQVSADAHLLMSKSYMVPPSMLIDRGVRVCRAVQRPGEWVITLPRAYHAGFSHGFSVAEAVNFCLTDWIPYALSAHEWYRTISREPVIDLEQIIINATKSGYSEEVATACKNLIEAEVKLRGAARALINKSGNGVREHVLDAEESTKNGGRGPPCEHCGHLCHLSFVRLSEQTSRRMSVVCLRHIHSLSGIGKVMLVYRHSDAELLEISEQGLTLSQGKSSKKSLPLPKTETSLPMPLQIAILAKKEAVIASFGVRRIKPCTQRPQNELR